MNWDQAKGNWKQFKGQVKQKWGKLTDDELDIIDGKREELAGKLQAHYGYAKERRKEKSMNSVHHASVDCDVVSTWLAYRASTLMRVAICPGIQTATS